MLVLNIFLIFLFLIICSDLYINYYPKTNLVLVPQDYKLRKKDNQKLATALKENLKKRKAQAIKKREKKVNNSEAKDG